MGMARVPLHTCTLDPLPVLTHHVTRGPRVHTHQLIWTPRVFVEKPVSAKRSPTWP